MKSLFFLLLLAASNATALTPEMSLYLRAGAGANGSGGGQECINNAGAWGNEFRIGNECGIYGEFGFGAFLLKGENDNAPFWRFFSNFAVAHANRTDWEGTTVSETHGGADPAYVTGVGLNNGNNWVMREVYTEGGNFDGALYNVWAGKRFYRWGDVHMMDFYPVSMSGPGGGFGGVHTSWGQWSGAVIQNASSSEINGNGNISTAAGPAAKTTLHLRLEGVDTPVGTFSFWLAQGQTPATRDTAGTQEYQGGRGTFFALKNNRVLAEGVWNELGLAYGSGVMTNMGPQGELVKDCAVDTDPSCEVARSYRARAWNSFTADLMKWSTQVALIYDELDKGTSRAAKVRWSSIGVRPMYWFTDHVSLMFQAGVSHIVDESDGFGSRTLQRYTIAPQLSLGKAFYSRPVLRAFYTRSQWNRNNMISAAGTSAAGRTSLDAIGLQTEIWF